MRLPAHRRPSQRALRLRPVPSATLRPPTRQRCTGRLATPGSRILLAVLFLVAIWLPSVLLSHGTDPTMLVVNMVLTCASLLVLAPSRRRKRSASDRHDSPPS